VRRLFATVAGLLVHATIAMAQVEEVLTFESWAHEGANTNFNNYVGTPREGYMVLSGVFGGHFGALGSGADFYAGSTGIFPLNSTTTILARTNGTAFDFLGISFARMTTNDAMIKVFGYRGCDLVAMQTWTLPAWPNGRSFVPFTTSLFSNVTEVRWTNAYPNVHQFNNVRVALNTNTIEPLPALQIQAFPYTNQYGETRVYCVVNAYGLIIGRNYAFEGSTNLVDWQAALPSFPSSQTFNKSFYQILPIAPKQFRRIRFE
jgi:hypothetical protein